MKNKTIGYGAAVAAALAVLVLSLVDPRWLVDLLGVERATHSEFHLPEQVSRAAMLMLLLVSALAFSAVQGGAGGLVSVAAVLLAVLLYAGEADFFNTSVQPVLLGPLMLFAAWLLWSRGLWTGLGVFLIGCGVALVAGVVDVVADHPDLMPSNALLISLIEVVQSLEERLEAVGLALVGVGLGLAQWPAVRVAVEQRAGSAFLAAAGLALAAVGASFMHHQYYISSSHLAVALGVALSGFALAVVGAERVARREPGLRSAGMVRLPVVHETVLVMIVLPLVYVDMNRWVSLLLWSALAGGLALYMLWKRPERSATPLVGGGVTVTATTGRQPELAAGGTLKGG